MCGENFDEEIKVMNFFEGLALQLGHEAFQSFMTQLSEYSKSYWIFARMTCTRLRAFPAINRWEVGNAPAFDGYLHILEYLHFDLQWTISSYLSTPHLHVAKWLVKNGICQSNHLFHEACWHNHKNVLKWCIANRFGGHSYFSPHVSVLKRLWKARLPLDHSIWDNGFYYGASEAKYAWAMGYPDEPNISVDKFVKKNPKMRLKMLKEISQSKFTNMTLLHRIITCFDEEVDDPEFYVPLEVCETLTLHVARAVVSEYCECGNPDNHENRQIPKRVKF